MCSEIADKPWALSEDNSGNSPFLIITPTSDLTSLFMHSSAISLSFTFKYLVLSGRLGTRSKSKYSRDTMRINEMLTTSMRGSKCIPPLRGAIAIYGGVVVSHGTAL